jgi:hypothetical protein
MSAELDELQEQLLAQERELDSRKGAIIAWEDGMTAFERAPGRVSWNTPLSTPRL